MPTGSNALQSAIYTRLTSELSEDVYDHIPQNASYPFVVIGADTVLPWDTKVGLIGFEFTVMIHAWTKPAAGRKSVKAILSDIYDALHHQESNISPSGYSVILFRFEFEDTIQETFEGDSDHYYHGVQRYRALIQSTS